MASPTQARRVAVHWFRKGLRLHDNPALLRAIQGYENPTAGANASANSSAVKQTTEHLVCVFVIDPFFAQPARVGVNRYQFLLESLTILDDQLKKRQSRLFLLKGKPEEVLPRALEVLDARLLTFEVDNEPYAIQRDTAVRSWCNRAGVEVCSYSSHTLYDHDALRAFVAGSGGDVQAVRTPATYKGFQALLSRFSSAPPAPASEPPRSFPPIPNDPSAMCALADLGYERVPTVEEIGYLETPTSPLRGGEVEGLRRMESFLAQKARVCSFEKPKTNPAMTLATEDASTTVLSPYLKFGVLSARLFNQRLAAVVSGHKHTEPPVSLQGQLLWREFFIYLGYITPNFDRIAGNHLVYNAQWQENEEFLDAYAEGRTGYPWIDAIMRQLKAEGWIHHLARHCVACFLTRGDLYLSWERGAAVFDRYLLDADWALNNANWMWLSGTSQLFTSYFRVYSPTAFPAKYGEAARKYVRHWVPEVAHLPDALLFEPWKSAIAIPHSTYPKPIIDHATALSANIASLKEVYARKERGDAVPAAGSAASNDQTAQVQLGSASSGLVPRSWLGSRHSHSKAPAENGRSSTDESPNTVQRSQPLKRRRR